MKSGHTPDAPRSAYEVYEAEDVRLLIAQYPLAWVCSAGTGDASLLPLIGVYDAAGKLVELIGHLPAPTLWARHFKRFRGRPFCSLGRTATYRQTMRGGGTGDQRGTMRNST